MTDETRRVSADAFAQGSPSAAEATRWVDPNARGGTRRVSAADVAAAASPSATPALPLGVLQPRAVLLENYTVEQTICPHETQQPGIYRCNSPDGQVIVKVAATNHPPKLELWDKLCELDHPHLVRTLATVLADGRYYEVQEYCSGGSLAVGEASEPSLTPEWVMERLIPQVCSALKYLHAQGIVHRDIKPANIYVRGSDGQNQLVVGDFDISSVLDIARTSRDTQRLAGTWFYSAPEAFPRYVESSATGLASRVSPAADYYSLGIMIVELLAGTTSLHTCELPDLFDFYLQGGRVALPEGIPERLSTLLKGLLIRNRQTRWGADEIERWLTNSNTRDDQRRILEDQTYELTKATQPYRLDDQIALDLPALAEAMSQRPEVAMEDLLGGEVMVNWIGLLDANVARVIKRDRERLRHHPRVALFAAMMRCDPVRPFIMPRNEVLTREELRDALVEVLADQGGSTIDQIGNSENVRCLAEWFRCKADPEPDVADRCEAIADREPGKQIDYSVRARLLEVLYLIDLTIPHVIFGDVIAESPQALALLAYGSPGDWTTDAPPAVYAEVHRQWRAGYIGAWLRQRGLHDLDAEVEAALDRAPGAGYASFEALLHALVPTLPPVLVQLDATELQRKLTATHGESATLAIPFYVIGSGMPFGAFMLTAEHPEISFSGNQMIDARRGQIKLQLDGTGAVPATHGFTAQIRIDGQYTALASGSANVVYSIAMPVARTLKRIAVGAALGGAVLGSARTMITLLAHPNPVNAAEINEGWVWRATLKWEFPRLVEIPALLALVGAAFAIWQLWLWAVKKSEG